jgi:M6 family metalloprotease-like protein
MKQKFDFLKLAWLCASMLIGTLAIGSPHHGTEMLFKQADGSMVKVKVYGDEFYQRVESIDGYTLIRNKKGWICYATVAVDQQDFVSTGVVYNGVTADNIKGFPHLRKGLRLGPEVIARKREAIRYELEKNAPPLKLREKNRLDGARSSTVDHVRGLAILIDFSDEPASITPDAIEQYFNQQGYSDYNNNGSIRDYFLDVSGGLLEYSNTVVGYYRARFPKTYYDSNTSYGRTSELLQEAFEWLEGTGFDFTSLTHENGQVRAVNFFYAGYPTQGWTYGLWPHMSYYSFTADGVRTGRYQITNIGASLTLATTCHENGHMVMGWPDLYDYGYDGFTSAGLGSFCLMAYQGAGNNPVPPNPYLRNIAGWDEVTNIRSTTGDIKLTANSNTSFMYDNPDNPNEYFLIESRMQTGRNASLPAEGMLIWHVDIAGFNEYQARTPEYHFMVSLEQADGEFGLEMASSWGDMNDAYRSDYRAAFNDYTLPDATWWNGARSNLSISNISNPGTTMTATIGSEVSLIQAPDNLTAQVEGSTVSLQWQDHSQNERGFRIERKSDYGSFSVIGNVGQNIVTYEDTPPAGSSGSYTYRVFAFNDTQGSLYSNEASVQQLQFPWAGSPASVSGIIDAEAFDFGGEGIAYHDVDNINRGGQFRTEGVDIEACSESGYNVGYMLQDEWIEYTIWVAFAGNYEISTRVASDNTTGRFHLEFNGVNKTGSIVVPRTNGWQNWTTVKSTVYLDEGVQVMRLYAEGYDFNVNNFSFNKLPEVFLNSPTDQSAYSTPADIFLSASAQDGDGAIERVEFYTGTTLIGMVNAYPYTFNWPNVGAGTYSVKARAYDYEGAWSDSPPATITVNASASSNLAFNKTVWVSSVESTTLSGNYAVDGNSVTRWSSAWTDPQYLTVDLGSSYGIERVKITWETARAWDFQIQGSLDNVNWTTLREVSNNALLINDLSGINSTVRYLKVYGISRATPYGYSIYELEVYGSTPPLPNIGLATPPRFEDMVMESSDDLIVYPNPTRNVVQIEIPGNGNASVTLVNTLSQIVKYVRKESGMEALTLTTEDLPEGTYLLAVKTNLRTQYRKILIQR